MLRISFQGLDPGLRILEPRAVEHLGPFCARPQHREITIYSCTSTEGAQRVLGQLDPLGGHAYGGGHRDCPR